MSVPPSCQNQTQVECPTELLSTVWKFQSNGMPLCPVNVMYADRRSGNRSLSTDVRRSNVCDSADRWIGVWTFGGYCHSCVALWFIMASPQAGDIRSMTALLHRCITTPSSTLSTDKIMLLFSSADRLLRCQWFMPRAHKEAAARPPPSEDSLPVTERSTRRSVCETFTFPQADNGIWTTYTGNERGRAIDLWQKTEVWCRHLPPRPALFSDNVTKKRLSHSADN